MLKERVHLHVCKQTNNNSHKKWHARHMTRSVHVQCMYTSYLYMYVQKLNCSPQWLTKWFWSVAESDGNRASMSITRDKLQITDCTFEMYHFPLKSHDALQQTLTITGTTTIDPGVWCCRDYNFTLYDQFTVVGLHVHSSTQKNTLYTEPARTRSYMYLQ